MAGWGDKPRWGLLGIAAAGFCLLVLPPVSSARRAPTVQRLRADDASLAAKSRSAVLALYSLDLRLSSARTRLASLQTETRRLRTERASIGYQLRLARLDARLSEDRLATRLRFLYDHGSTSTLEVLFGAKSLDDAMIQLDDFDRVTTANQDVLAQVRSSQSRLTRLSHSLALHQRGLVAATREAAAMADELEHARAERSAYIAELTRRRALDSTQLKRLDAQARAAEAVSRQLTRSGARSVTNAAPSSVAPQTRTSGRPGGRTLIVVATGYDLRGTTSTGLPVGWGVAAVDPSVIPLGTHLTIPGYGEAIAADTGSAVTGSTIDLWFPTLAQAAAWGRRSIKIALH